MTEEASPDETMERLTGGWFPVLPKAYEKSVVLGGARVLYPCSDPEKTAETLKAHTRGVASRAFRAGHAAGKAEIRKAIFG